MDWFTKVFVSLKVGTDGFTGLLAPPVILNGTPPVWRGLYSERSKMHSGKGHTGWRGRSLFVGPSKSSREK